MEKLDDIPKKRFFTAPDDYFEKLPARIHSRINGAPRPFAARTVRVAFQYAIPILAIAAIIFFYPTGSPDVETILASVETEDMIEYLHDSGMSAEDVLETAGFSPADLDAIEEELYRQSLFTIDSTRLDH